LIDANDYKSRYQDVRYFFIGEILDDGSIKNEDGNNS